VTSASTLSESALGDSPSTAVCRTRLLSLWKIIDQLLRYDSVHSRRPACSGPTTRCRMPVVNATSAASSAYTRASATVGYSGRRRIRHGPTGSNRRGSPRCIFFSMSTRRLR